MDNFALSRWVIIQSTMDRPGAFLSPISPQTLQANLKLLFDMINHVFWSVPLISKHYHLRSAVDKSTGHRVMEQEGIHRLSKTGRASMPGFKGSVLLGTGVPWFCWVIRWCQRGPSRGYTGLEGVGTQARVKGKENPPRAEVMYTGTVAWSMPTWSGDRHVHLWTQVTKDFSNVTGHSWLASQVDCTD